MYKIKDYLKLSETALNVKKTYEQSEVFRNIYCEIEGREKDSFINHYIIQNVPFIFQEYPLLYEGIIKYLADNLQIGISDIKLIGSAKTGFSISPHPNYGKIFSEKSDLDFSIINQNLFDRLVGEFNTFKRLYSSQELMPTPAEVEYWKDNYIRVTKNIENGFIDSYKIPNRAPFPLARKISDSLYLVTFKLDEFHKIPNSKASVRVYKDWETFTSQIRKNTDHIINNLP